MAQTRHSKRIELHTDLGSSVDQDHALHSVTNRVSMHKAVAYSAHGVAGINLANPQCASYSMERHVPLFGRARATGLAITMHTDEEGSLEGLRYVVHII